MEEFHQETAAHNVKIRDLGVIATGKNFAVKNYILFREINDKT